MKLFITAIVAATIIGGFVGGELTNTLFTLTGAVIGGVGLTALLLGLGAYFDAQERQRRDKALPPDVRAVFDRMTDKAQASSPAERLNSQAARSRVGSKADAVPSLDLRAVIADLMAQDAAAIARGETPQRRLIPHHAIKRDVIIAAYTKDFQNTTGGVASMSWTRAEKETLLSQLTKDFEKHIDGVSQLGPEDLDKVMALMKRTRTDLADVERDVRASNPIYSMVDPL